MFSIGTFLRLGMKYFFRFNIEHPVQRNTLSRIKSNKILQNHAGHERMITEGNRNSIASGQSLYSQCIQEIFNNDNKDIFYILNQFY